VTDVDLMRRALFHAARAAGATAPNPMVGAVVVSAEGVIVGQARHPKAGEAHAGSVPAGSRVSSLPWRTPIRW
jgi:diaminohydroxyphosphoribosylaminopyrimidine deaminase/5-amino-6-(5-phosphoribosylamino)uracil reductase